LLFPQQEEIMTKNAGNVLCTEVVPRLQSAIPYAVSFVGCEDAEEIIQDAMAFAAKMIHNAERKGKKITRSATGRHSDISAGNIAYYTIQHIKSSRRSVGYSASDVHGSATQLKGRSRLNSLDEVVARDEETGGEIFLLHDVLSRDEEDPGARAARKMDGQEFVAALPERERMAVEFMVQGKSLRDAAHVLRVSDSAMQSSKRTLRVKILEFMGFDILAQVQCRPQWKQNLETIRRLW
jgi:hypothetical protein